MARLTSQHPTRWVPFSPREEQQAGFYGLDFRDLQKVLRNVSNDNIAHTYTDELSLARHARILLDAVRKEWRRIAHLEAENEDLRKRLKLEQLQNKQQGDRPCREI